MVYLEQLLKQFKNKALLEQALTHRSWVNENPGKQNHNERLEFLGDAVLEFVVTDYLYKKFSDKSEGYLTNLRANIVNTVNLSNFAKRINLRESILLSKGEEKTGKSSNALLADTVEAIIGAIYLDQGIETVREFIEMNILSDLKKKISEPLKDAKSTLQEFVQAKKGTNPKYKVVKTEGPDHALIFTVHVYVAGELQGEGKGESKSIAEQKAAGIALLRLSL